VRRGIPVRSVPLLAVLLAVLLTAPSAPAPGASADLALVSGPGVAQCREVQVGLAGPQVLDLSCGAGTVQPGVGSSGCTLNFVMTDGTDHYIGTAGHCGGVGKTYHVAGLGAIGVVVFREAATSDLLALRDWALIRVDPALASAVDGAMLRWGGPLGAPGVPGTHVRAPAPGDVGLLYGNGKGLGEEDATRGRVMPVVAPLGTTAFALVGTVGPGDSGSPVRAATGQALGIAIAGAGIVTGDNDGFVQGLCGAGGVPAACQAVADACAELEGACDGAFHDGNIGPVVVATRMDAALAAFEAHLGRPLWIVGGGLPV